MAIDQSLLESTVETRVVTLRFYQWEVPTLSLGYFQKLADRALHAESSDSSIVRRTSGGGAIIHDRELTYSLCVPTDGALAKANTQLYDVVHHAIGDALLRQSVVVSLFESSKGQTMKADKSDPFLCFQRRADGDLVCQSHKVGGSAQRRLKNVLLQHGSLLLAGSEKAPQLPGLMELTGVTVETDALIDHVTNKLSDFFGMEFVRQSMTPREMERARVIESTKFNDEQWLTKR